MKDVAGNEATYADITFELRTAPSRHPFPPSLPAATMTTTQAATIPEVTLPAAIPLVVTPLVVTLLAVISLAAIPPTTQPPTPPSTAKYR
ncbi:hypothetical protein [Parabacteroides sp. AF48-14]|uniref:hypothetical protein n=1 Tax=Parabacteroides sp. AF48-14 TaxID=2292052 RepID=UPI0011C43826|nr:hypothetical protein [Parabacteroides sp. AF48-14]